MTLALGWPSTLSLVLLALLILSVITLRKKCLAASALVCHLESCTKSTQMIQGRNKRLAELASLCARTRLVLKGQNSSESAGQVRLLLDRYSASMGLLPDATHSALHSFKNAVFVAESVRKGCLQHAKLSSGLIERLDETYVNFIETCLMDVTGVDGQNGD